MKHDFKEFLASKGIKMETTAFISVIDGYMRQPDFLALVEEFMYRNITFTVKISPPSNPLVIPGTYAEFPPSPHETSAMICVKNVDCDFTDLRNRLDKISPTFTVEKDTFVYYTSDESLYDRLEILKKHLSNLKKGTIIVEKAGQ